MTVILEYIQNQDYEGMQIHYTKADGTDLDISGATEIVFRVYSQDGSTLEFSGSKTGAEVAFLTDGTDGKAVFSPGADDMDTAGLFKCEVETTLGGKDLKKQECLVKIDPEAPTS